MMRRQWMIIAVVVGALLLVVLPLRWYVRLLGLGSVGILVLNDYRRHATRTNASAVWAWAVTRFLEAIGRDLDAFALDTTTLAGIGDRSFLEASQIPPRAGERPAMVRGVPHRQLTQQPSPALRTYLRDRLSTLEDFRGEGRPLRFRQSLWELTGAEALIVDGCTAADCGAALRRARGEFAHLHSHDGSLHVMLSAPDALAVIEKGWGELFAVAGALGGRIPWIVLVYAPRSEEECETVIEISRAGYRWALQPAEARS